MIGIMTILLCSAAEILCTTLSMGRKRNLSEDGGREDEEEKPMKDRRVKEKQEGRESMRPSMIKNKEKRAVVHAKLKQQKKVEKRKKVKAREAAEKKKHLC
uniref:Serpin n=1 Tax=Solanum tuberosum TaxID=4113 RepID=M1AUE1_SOLTU